MIGRNSIAQKFGKFSEHKLKIVKKTITFY